MKKNIKFLVMAAVAAFAMSACQKSTPYVESVDFYMLGTNNIDDGTVQSVIFKNADELYTIDKGYVMYGLGYANKSLYAAGQKLPAGEAQYGNPAIWQDGQFLTLPINSETGAINALLSVGDTRYYSGVVVRGGKQYGVILMNEKLEYVLEEEGTSYFKMAIGASGDLYVLGTKNGGAFYDRINTVTFKPVARVIIADEGTDVYPTDIYVGYRDIVVACNKNVGEDQRACMWLDTQLVLLSQSNSHANCAALYNGYCHVGGSVVKDGGAKAVLWTNSYPQDYSYGCNANSVVHLMYNSGYYLYQAIGSENKVQICCNGGLMFDVQTPKDFWPMDWCIIRK